MNFMLSAIIWNVGRVCFVSHRGTLDSTVPPCRFFKVGKCIYGENCRYFSKLLSGYVWRWVSWFDHSTFSIGICTKWMLNPMNCPTVQLMLRHWVSHKQASLNGFTHISFTASFDAIFHLTMLFSLDWVNAPEFIPSSVVYYPAAADSQFDFPAIKSSEKTSKLKLTIRDFSKMYKFSPPFKKIRCWWTRRSWTEHLPTATCKIICKSCGSQCWPELQDCSFNISNLPLLLHGFVPIRWRVHVHSRWCLRALRPQLPTSNGWSTKRRAQSSKLNPKLYHSTNEAQ